MLLTRGAASYTNDGNGNTLTGGGRTNTWDGQNRLAQCVYNGTTTTHSYGSDGLRRQTVQGTTTTDFALDGQSVVRTFTNGAVDRTYLHGARGPEYERTGNNAPQWYLYDGLGSVLGTVDSAGNVTSARKYDVYGAVRGLTGQSGSRHKWVGGLGHPSEDEMGLVYMRARYYDPVTGRFASEDPAKDGSNWFAYGKANPIRFTDPNGKRAETLEEKTTLWVLETFATALVTGGGLAALATIGSQMSAMFNLLIDFAKSAFQQPNHWLRFVEYGNSIDKYAFRTISNGRVGIAAIASIMFGAGIKYQVESERNRILME